jgi:hypothetical protein
VDDQHHTGRDAQRAQIGGEGGDGVWKFGCFGWQRHFAGLLIGVFGAARSKSRISIPDPLSRSAQL